MSTSSKTSRVRIGRIIGVHGVRGRLKVLPLTDSPERFEAMDSMAVYGADGVHTMTVTPTSVRWVPGKRLLVVETEEIRRREVAESFLGHFIEVMPDERYELEEGAYWVDDLIGLSVKEEGTDRSLGVLSDVLAAGENDLYAVRDHGGKEHYIPAVKEFISAVDLEKREIRVTLAEGLWESCV